MPRANMNSFISVEVTVLSGNMKVVLEIRKFNSTTWLYQRAAKSLMEQGLDLAGAELILVSPGGVKLLPHDTFVNYMTAKEKADFVEGGRILAGRKGIALSINLTAYAQKYRSGVLPWHVLDVAERMSHPVERYLLPVEDVPLHHVEAEEAP